MEGGDRDGEGDPFPLSPLITPSLSYLITPSLTTPSLKEGGDEG